MTRFFVFLKESDSMQHKINDFEIIGMLIDAETLSYQIPNIKQEKPKDVSRMVILTIRLSNSSTGHHRHKRSWIYKSIGVAYFGVVRFSRDSCPLHLDYDKEMALFEM